MCIAYTAMLTLWDRRVRLRVVCVLLLRGHRAQLASVAECLREGEGRLPLLLPEYSTYSYTKVRTYIHVSVCVCMYTCTQHACTYGIMREFACTDLPCIYDNPRICACIYIYVYIYTNICTNHIWGVCEEGSSTKTIILLPSWKPGESPLSWFLDQWDLRSQTKGHLYCLPAKSSETFQKQLFKPTKWRILVRV